MHSGGTLYIDDIRIVDESGNPITISLDEDTNVTNIGLYLASIIAGTHMGFMKEQEAIERISVTLNSIGQLQKWKGFPQTHNHIVSLTPAKGDRLVSTVDSGNFAAGLIVVKERFPQFQQEISLILDAMEWDWFFDFDRNLPTGGRYPDGTKANWHYNWLCADSRTAHLIGIGTEKLPPDSWNNLDRDIHPAKCINENDWFFEPGWNGGGLFMALLPQIFINEKGTELETSAKNFIQDQICYASSIGMPAWGNSATALPPYGAEYCGYNCVRTDIIVPHASMLAAQYVTTDELYNNLIKLESMGARIRGSNGKIVQDFGFCTSLNWTNNQPSTAFLILDQCMAFLSLTNKLTDGSIQKLFHQDEVVLRAMELIR
jgi:hypothetical protein